MSITSVRLSDDIFSKLNKLTSKLRRSKGWIINDALAEYIEKEEKKQNMLAQTQEALADIKAGKVVSGEEVMNWLKSWGKDNELKAPKI